MTSAALAAEPEPAIKWVGWSDKIFEQAKRENRFVLLDLGAGWCHWCHVMEEITYHDPEVSRLIGGQYLAVHVDQDSRPDLANRYEDYGWPATIVFNTDGSEIVKRQGYIPPKPMASLLQAIIDDPSPGPSVTPEVAIEANSTATLTPERREELRKVLVDNYDQEHRGWGTIHKYIDCDVIEYCLGEAERGGTSWETQARETLQEARALIDPVWGGIYQYSTDGDWQHPHFEKIMSMQAEDLRIYSLAYARWKNPADLRSAQAIRDYLDRFLSSPEGAFFTSQDADVVPGEHSGEFFALDDAGRRAKGIPRVDTHTYARENGWAISGLCAFYNASGDAAALERGVQAAKWVLERRARPEGGFKHDAEESAGPYLGDTVAMARAFLSLFASTADRAWLVQAEKAMRFADGTFRSEAGYKTAAVAGALKVQPQLDENIAMARTANLLLHYTGSTDYRKIAEHAAAYLTAKGVAENRGLLIGGILLVDRELSSPPLHLTIVGPKGDPAAKELYQIALGAPATYKRVDWLDHAEGSLPNPDLEYPKLSKAAAFVCTATTCSAPIADAAKLSEKLRSGTKSR